MIIQQGGPLIRYLLRVEDVEAGGEKLVTLNVSIRSGEDNKAFTINLTASSDEAQKENPPKYANKTVSIITIVNQEYWIDLSVADADRTVEAYSGSSGICKD